MNPLIAISSVVVWLLVGGVVSGIVEMVGGGPLEGADEKVGIVVIWPLAVLFLLVYVCAEVIPARINGRK